MTRTIKLRRTGWIKTEDGKEVSSLALTVPSAIASALGFKEGDRFRVEIIGTREIKFVKVE
jgi:antitoxin component of MazEF toxin-antitoxin module